MKTELQLYIKNVFGSELLYTTDNPKLWERLTGKKTFTAEICSTLDKLGYEIKILRPETGNFTTYQSFFNFI